MYQSFDALGKPNLHGVRPGPNPKMAGPTGLDAAGEGPKTDRQAQSGHKSNPEALPSPSSKLRLLAVCLINFTNALSDTAPSALIPFMGRHYNTTPALLSLLFVAIALGFIIAAVFIEDIADRLGRAKTYAVGQLLVAAGYIPVVCAAPFPVFVLSFFLVGFGLSFNLALSNVFCGSLRSGTSALGAMHGAYGVGASVGPLVASFAARTDWTKYYLLMLGLTLLGGAFAMYAFWDYEKDTKPAAGDDADQKQDLQGMFTPVSTGVVMMGALFMFAYRAAEVSISTARPTGSLSFVFWAGITIARWLIWAPAQRIDEKKLVYALVVCAAGSEMLIWLAPIMVSNATTFAMGLLLGPVYPCAAAVFMRSIGKHEQVSGIGVISAFGSSGGAAAPFTAGVLAELVGPAVLHPIAILLFGVMVSCWYGLPKMPKRME